MKKTLLIVFSLLFVGIIAVIGLFKSDLLPYKYKHCVELFRAKSLLKDDLSKAVFDSTVEFNNRKHKLFLADFDEYNHPIVKIHDGDIVIDGGVSKDLSSTVDILNRAGKSGKVIGFEPDKTILDEMYSKAKKYPNLIIYPYGLWDKKETKTMFLNILPDGSYNGSASVVVDLPFIPEVKKQKIDVELVKFDDFAKENNINKVDFIKLDIEGAELQALQGAEECLKTNKPNLAVSIYHLDSDLYSIILYLDSLHLGYQYWVVLHPPADELIRNVLLYATVRDKQAE
ncbi:MAG: FkbM family methyltransferase [Candidatus Gastranaerophilales bacterium]|nr:FkbM family methyltransferase [Candidatus Gastranaerophilales bacterium]